MKTFLVFLCFALVTLAHHLPEDEKQKLKEIHESCQSDPATYCDEALLKKLGDNVDVPKVGTHMLCMSINAGLQNKDGELLKDIIKTKVALVVHDQSKVDGLVQKCAVKKETPEKTAVLLWWCFVENDIHYYHKIE